MGKQEENQEFKLINLDWKCLKTEVEQVKTLLAAMEHREKLVERLAPVSDTLCLCKSVHDTNHEPWDGDIWYNNDDDKATENPDSKCESFLC